MLLLETDFSLKKKALFCAFSNAAGPGSGGSRWRGSTALSHLVISLLVGRASPFSSWRQEDPRAPSSSRCSDTTQHRTCTPLPRWFSHAGFPPPLSPSGGLVLRDEHCPPCCRCLALASPSPFPLVVPIQSFFLPVSAPWSRFHFPAPVPCTCLPSFLVTSPPFL